MNRLSRFRGAQASRVSQTHGCKSELRAWEDCLSFVHRRPLGLARRDARMHADPGVHGLSTEDARSDAPNSSTTMALIWSHRSMLADNRHPNVGCSHWRERRGHETLRSRSHAKPDSPPPTAAVFKQEYQPCSSLSPQTTS